MKAVNVNSKNPPGQELLQYIKERAGFLSDLVQEIPIYFIDKELMDYIRPPWKKTFLDQNWVQEYLYEEKKKKPKRIYSNLWEKQGEYSQQGFYTTAVGVYFQKLSKNKLRQVRKSFKQPPVEITLPAVFFSPERVEEWSQKLKQRRDINISFKRIYKNIFTGVLLHELVHAYLNTQEHILRTSWGSTIEESLANTVVFRSLGTGSDQGILDSALSEQPLEYRGYHYLKNLKKEQLLELFSAWSQNQTLNPGLVNWGFGENKGAADFYRNTFKLISQDNRYKAWFWQYYAQKILKNIIILESG